MFFFPEGSEAKVREKQRERKKEKRRKTGHKDAVGTDRSMRERNVGNWAELPAAAP